MQPQESDKILLAIGELKGQSSANYEAIFKQLTLLHEQAARTEEKIGKVEALAASFDARIENCEKRIDTLEEDNKSNIKDIAKNSVTASGITSIIINAGLEVIKHLAA